MTRMETLVETPWLLLEAEFAGGVIVRYWRNGRLLNYTLLGGRP